MNQKSWPDLISLQPHDSVFMPERRFVPGRGIRRSGKQSRKSLLRTADSCLQKQKYSEMMAAGEEEAEKR